MEIEHFSHVHPLILSEEEDGRILCNGCQKGLSGPTYGCSHCKYFLHRSCAELPHEIQCFFHPCSLTLQITRYYESGFVYCNACSKSHWGLYYHCDWCQYDVGAECALQATITPEDDTDEQIRHFSHAHPLALAEKKEDDEVSCKVCGKLCLGLAYGCNQCNFFLHKSCMDDLPKVIRHFFHPCPLVLLSTCKYYCEACDQERSGLAFCCGRCNILLDVECALLPTLDSEGAKQIPHFSHGHLLTLYESNHINDEICCKACSQNCSGSTYGCSRCDFYLHKSCAELPIQIKHPFHSRHPLLLVPLKGDGFLPHLPCFVCGKQCGYLSYFCMSCPCVFDINCTSLKPNKKYENHEHLLVWIEEGCAKHYCKSCWKSCNASHLRCVECDFSLHVECHPSVPHSIKHKCHIDPLALTKLPVPDDLDSDDEFYCDACETLRDPKDPVYYCVECDFIAHIDCVISAVLPHITDEGSSSKEKDGSSVDPVIAKLNRDIEEVRAAMEEVKVESERMQEVREEKEKERKMLEARLQSVITETEGFAEALNTAVQQLKVVKDERARYIASTEANTENSGGVAATERLATGAALLSSLSLSSSVLSLSSTSPAISLSSSLSPQLLISYIGGNIHYLKVFL